MQFKIGHRIRKRLRKEEYAIRYNTENPAAEKGNGNTMAEDGLGAAHRHIAVSLQRQYNVRLRRERPLARHTVSCKRQKQKALQLRGVAMPQTGTLYTWKAKSCRAYAGAVAEIFCREAGNKLKW